jgi:hypothetical protein
VSLLSPNHLTLLLGQHSVEGLHTSSWSQKSTAFHRVECDPNDSDRWGALTQAVNQLLEICKPEKVKILLSDHVIRYLCTPWRLDLRNAEERASFSAVLFSDIYGEGSLADWALSSSDWYPGRSCLTAAISKTLLANLVSTGERTHIELTFMRPMLVASLRLCAPALPKVGWFASHEPGRTSLIGWNKEGYQWVSSIRLVDDSQACLEETVERELLLARNLPDDLFQVNNLVVFSTSLKLQDQVTARGLKITSWKFPEAVLIRASNRLSDSNEINESDLYRIALLGALS